ncbi:MAG: type II toxin-antitoxin system VapC family toxin [Rhodospirillales bacterium]|nr:type II toxin-antitoxin system VapC family toxin [Rhodospirillales bacterium]
MIGWLLDTNVVAELARPGCDAKVAAWARQAPEERLYISILTLAEYDQGVAKLGPGAHARPRLAAAVAALEARFQGRVLSLDDSSVRLWGRISGRVARESGRPPPVVDTLLAAQAIERDLYLATRNVRDVRDSGAALFDPWRDDPAGCEVEG